VGETVTEGTIERWLKKPGDAVTKYEPIVEINTDKVNVELPSPVSGTFMEIIAQEGETVPVGAPLAVIEEVAGDKPADITPAAPKEAPPAAASATSAPATVSAPAAPERPGGNGAGGRATPRVRKLAAELGVDLAAVSGTGPAGRIVEGDVRAAASGAPAAAAGPATPVEPRIAAIAGAEDQSVAITSVRRTIAQRMSQSLFSAPHAWLAMDADVSGLVSLRKANRESFRDRYGVDLTYLPFMVHAVAQALPAHPYLNASWAEDKIILRKRVNIGIAVATERGLFVPVIHDADTLSIAGLAQAITDLGERTRAARLKIEEVQGGTFTVDNTGAFGSVLSVPIVNLGQSAIITMEAITKRPVVVDGDAIAVRSMLTLCLSFDHRVLDGHVAGAFLGEMKRRLEAYGPGTGLE
jgi:2-oxoisovalerate dehydrogenase E2 component (dihydrolipoyl transacylase)